MKKAPQELVVRTEKMVYGGQALARADRFVVFVDELVVADAVVGSRRIACEINGVLPDKP